MENKLKSSNTINILRPVLLLLVIFNHCTPGLENISNENDYILNLFRIYFGKTLTPAAVSVFFVISGYLYFANIQQFNKKIYISKTKSRLKTLVVPYILWNFAGVIIIFINGKQEVLSSITKFLSYFWCNNVWNDNTLNCLGLNTPLYAPIDWPLWYLRDLIVMSFLSPLIYWAVKKFKLMYIILLIPFFVLNIWTIIPGLGVSSFLFFGLGVYLAIYKREMNLGFGKSLKITTLITALVLSVLSAYLWMKDGITISNYSLYTLSTVVLVPSILIVGEILSKKGMKPIEIMVTSSFFVYAFHAFPSINPILFLNKITKALQVDNSVVIYLVIPFIVYGVCVLVYYLLNRYFPRLIHLTTGR